MEFNTPGLTGVKNSFKLSMLMDDTISHFESANLDNSEPVDDYITRRLNQAAFVEVSFAQSSYQKIIKGVRATTSEKMAIVGGTLGLFSGISFVSLIEIAFWIIRAVNIKIYEHIRKAGDS